VGDRTNPDTVRYLQVSEHIVSWSILRYGLFHDIPWSILGFRLKKGVDKKDCLEVRVEGIVKSRGADIKVTNRVPSL
jgi:hypothetical protein